jgi:hypothetical protein
MIVAGGEIGQVVENGKVTKQYQALDTDMFDYCWNHSPTLTSDWNNPNEEDKKKLNEIKLKVIECTNKDGTKYKVRFCPKCKQVVQYTKPI